MKYEYNDGSLEDHAVQNRFTAYLKAAVNHHRAKYIQRLRQQQQKEIVLFESEDIPSELGFASSDDLLPRALAQLRAQSQQILLEHIVQGKPLVQLALELGLPYPTVCAIYRRALKKLREELLRDEFY
ncbi:MAG: sigma-70 family RNA polymerase sigma factor [Oscillospiraceae bacterium]|nr:sigma-70 family RNA polymerase sigma factor [Oscillospiraceae bacterium]